MKPIVFFHPVDKKNLTQISSISLNLLEAVIKENKIKLEKEIPIKVHPGNPGNITFIKPSAFSAVIRYLKNKKIKTYFIETNQAPIGERSKASTHLKIAQRHGFTEIPFVIADGEDGFDHLLVKIKSGKHFKDCKIALKLVDKKQIIIMSHFKGHMLSGFGGAIKMLGLGFASGRGKIEVHSKINLRDGEPIHWSKIWTLYYGKEFRERTAEYALAASQNKQFIYITFALDITKDCDCDGKKMKPIYKDLGIFASTDPVAIDKAVFDLLAKREEKKPFTGEDIFSYSEAIGLGSQQYRIAKLDN